MFRAFGQVSLVEIPLADANLEVHTDGYVKMLARFSWGHRGLATLKGFVRFEMLAPKFNAEGLRRGLPRVRRLVRRARALVSSKGVAVCAKIDVLVDDWEPGFGYRWGDTFPDALPGRLRRRALPRAHCARLRERGASGRREATLAAIELPAGLPGAVVALEGRDAPPKVTLAGPNGERITTPDGVMPVEQSPFFVLKDPRAKLTQIAISKPSAGRWTVEVAEGSSEVVSLRSAKGLDEPKITARVTGRGHRRALHCRITPAEGQKVTFSEDGASTGGAIGVATRRAGTSASCRPTVRPSAGRSWPWSSRTAGCATRSRWPATVRRRPAGPGDPRDCACGAPGRPWWRPGVPPAERAATRSRHASATGAGSASPPGAAASSCGAPAGR